MSRMHYLCIKYKDISSSNIKKTRKKLSFFAVALAAMAFAACGGNKSAQTEENSDSLVVFEQQQIEAAIKMNFDSLAAEVARLKQLPVVQKNGMIVLTDEEKQVRPHYLLDLSVAEEAMTLAEEYRVLSALEVDKEVAALYDLPMEGYDKAIAKLVADINDPSFKVLDSEYSIYESSQMLYDAMNENGRINFYWQIVSASLVEQLYIISKNADKFLASFDDDAASNVSLRIILIQDAINRLTEYDPELLPVAEAIDPLVVINATTVDEFKKQIVEAGDQIAQARQALIELVY